MSKKKLMNTTSNTESAKGALRNPISKIEVKFELDDKGLLDTAYFSDGKNELLLNSNGCHCLLGWMLSSAFSQPAIKKSLEGFANWRMHHQGETHTNLAYFSVKPRVVCAWCEPGCHEPNVTHGICEKHKAEQLAQLGKAGAL